MGGGPRIPRSRVEPLALEAQAAIGGTICGSLRRGCEMVGDIDLVLPHGTDITGVTESLRSLGWTLEETGVPRSRFVRPFHRLFPMELDVWIAAEGSLGAALAHATGCGLLNTVMRRWGLFNGMKLSWRGVQRLSDGAWLGRETEIDVFSALGWPALEPHQREDFMSVAEPFLEVMNAQHP